MNDIPRIAVTAVTFSKNEQLVRELSDLFPNYSINKLGRTYSESQLIESLRDANGAIIGSDRITENLLAQCPTLRAIANNGIGTDKVDFDACKKYGISFLTQQSTNQRDVSELTLGFILGLMRGGYRASLELKAGNWNKYENNGKRFTGKKIGIIGMGNIGKDLVSLLGPFGCEIIANDAKQDELCTFYQEHGIKAVSKEEIFRESDIVTIHAPLTDETRNMVNKRTLSMMKPSSFLINTARGKIVDDVALYDALKKGKIAGAALDVYNGEDQPEFYATPLYRLLLSLPNVISTPHMAGTSLESALAVGRKSIDNLRSYFGK